MGYNHHRYSARFYILLGIMIIVMLMLSAIRDALILQKEELNNKSSTIPKVIISHLLSPFVNLVALEGFLEFESPTSRNQSTPISLYAVTVSLSGRSVVGRLVRKQEASGSNPDRSTRILHQMLNSKFWNNPR